MTPDLEVEAGRWLLQAGDDLETAQRLADMGIHYASCFFCQQAAEKALKAVLYGRGAERVLGHSVADLAKDIAAAMPGSSSLAAELAPLDLYYIPTRYPNGLPGGVPSAVFNAEDSDRALRLARRAVEAARSLLSSAEA